MKVSFTLPIASCNNCQTGHPTTSFNKKYFANIFFIFLILRPFTVLGIQDAEIFLLLGHKNTVNSTCYSPGGTTIVSASDDRTVKIWDVASKKLLRTFSQHQSAVLSASFSPDGQTIVSGSYGGSIYVWNVNSGELLKALRRHAGAVTAVSFSPDGRNILSAGTDGKVILSNAETGEVEKEFKGHAGKVLTASFSTDGRRIVTGDDESTIRIWNSADGRQVRNSPLRGHKGPVRSARFSPDGQLLASAGNDQSICLWDLSTGNLFKTLSGHEGAVFAISFSPDGGTIASASEDKTVRLWDVDSGKLIRTIGDHDDGVRSVFFAPNGETFATGSNDKSIRLWKTATGKSAGKLEGHDGGIIKSVIFSSPSSDRGGILSASGLARVPNTPPTSLGQARLPIGQEGVIKLWNYKTGRPVQTYSGHKDSVNSVSTVSISKNLQLIVSASDDHTVKIWDISSEKLLKTLKGHIGPVNSAVFGPSHKIVISAGDDQTVRLWNTGSGKIIKTLRGHNGPIFSLDFSPQNQTIASAGRDEIIRLWNISNGKIIHKLKGHKGAVYCVRFSADGKSLVSAGEDKTVRIWDVRSARPYMILLGHTGSVYSASFSPVGKMVLSAGDDKSIRLWDYAAGQPGQVFQGHEGAVLSAAFENNGQTIVSSGTDNFILTWRIGRKAPQKKIIPFPTAGEWLAYQPGHLYYNSSLQGDEYAAVRFNHQLKENYPLSYYRNKLKKQDNWFDLNKNPPPIIRPRPILRWWENFEYRGLLYSLMFSGLLISMAFIQVLRWRRDPMRLARKFFSLAGYPKASSFGRNLLHLRTENGKVALAVLWSESRSVRGQWKAPFRGRQACNRLYLIYTAGKPTIGVIRKLRKKGCEVIPLSTRRLEESILTRNASDIKETLNVWEEPYVVRSDPYLNFDPIYDPNWFFGRDAIMKRLSHFLAQGHHVGIFGLRKVGKTSLIHQIVTRLSDDTLMVIVDCQSVDANADALLEATLEQLLEKLASRQIPNRPPLRKLKDTDFRTQIKDLFACWQKSGRSQPFVIIFDEIDKLFVHRKLAQNEPTLLEYVKLFRLLRGLAQNHRCLVTMVTAYRPDINRHNLLTPMVGENPMFNSFQEQYLGFLNQKDSHRMLVEIGVWKDIFWDDAATQKVYHYCAGHPLVTRCLASRACDGGKIKHIDITILENCVQDIIKNLYRDDIANYYNEGIWKVLNKMEQKAIEHITTGNQRALSDPNYHESLVSLDNLGLIQHHNDTYKITAVLFQEWLQWRL